MPQAMHLLRWPLPALLSWGAAWASFMGLMASGLALGPAMVASALVGAGLALLHQARWRRLIVALGFPLSMLVVLRSAALPAWGWLLPLGLLALAYPRRTWSDAPWFPTPRGALAALGELAPLPVNSAILDVGCGLGDGLRELHQVYPHAHIEGIEWSRLLARLAAWRCPWAKIQRGDMWTQDWARFALVYVFQRPETMDRVWVKACREMRPTAYLVSLDFEIGGQIPLATLPLSRGHSLWLYRPQALAPDSC
ncbi:class I SAM-dependent methyltransferase [Paucibacter sp. B2R-40]|uniref:class I SAM-dependent methyltransferase n=1 Tax=Paucibacter sp. B2R-40 TaxID=2893554 RepID=UPI0021E3E0B4|nr:class I SAM-dependent methyltransferase [Paucibacter sp. B2R-40]MCV2355002.1 class I SAM-dependent methyltransferase [Paucibacter sp. B2R-40]